ncbi:lipase chaperone [Vibrio sp. S4M6]|uniref:lipase secretion chaperone n=1 Tax=Vibrio sinus TaxID=2946865 RepID=UPI00202A9F1F|nr:lipase secretion chaperone [Vibrio sinus]MCL9783020.1 lipase chaperone [Vibrio sinus]
MKKTVLALIGVISAVGAVYIYHDIDPSNSSYKVTSQQDTKVDKSSPRDTFEYFLSGLGEADLPTIKQHFKEYDQLQDMDEQAKLDLFNRYIKYRKALQNIGNLNIKQLNYAALKKLDSRLLELQKQFFTPEQRQQLFSEEAQLRHIALRQMELRQIAANDADYNTLWQQELQTLPENLQKSYRNASLLGQLQKTDKMAGQDRYLQQEELVGPAAADRLAHLRSERAEFQNTFDHYLKRRDKIESDSSMGQDAKNRAVQKLRQTMFSAKQQRRIQALESIYAQQ